MQSAGRKNNPAHNSFKPKPKEITMKMLLKDLTDEQLKKIAENRPDPDFMAEYQTDWMADCLPVYSKKEVPVEIEKIIGQ